MRFKNKLNIKRVIIMRINKPDSEMKKGQLKRKDDEGHRLSLFVVESIIEVTGNKWKEDGICKYNSENL